MKETSIPKTSVGSWTTCLKATTIVCDRDLEVRGKVLPRLYVAYVPLFPLQSKAQRPQDSRVGSCRALGLGRGAIQSLSLPQFLTLYVSHLNSLSLHFLNSGGVYKQCLSHRVCECK